MDYFPAFLDLRDRPCLVIGGGEVALRKLRLLLSAGASVTAIAPDFSATFVAFADAHGVARVQRPFDARDVSGVWLVVSATGDADVERRVYVAANEAGVFCNGVDSVGNCSYITPAIVDRGPIVVAISSGGAAPVLTRQLREKIEALLPAGLAQLAELARRWRGRVSAQFRNLTSRRRFWEAVFDGPVASRALAGNIEAAERHMTSMIETVQPANGGEAWLVGAGPGDPGLLTLRALQAMQSADVILHDRLVSDEVLALARRDAELIPVGKNPGGRSCPQEDINGLLVSLVGQGKRICRLKGGDPFIFGRGGEEAAALDAAGLPYHVVPGITAAAGCAAAAGIPLTHRDAAQSVTLVTAHGKDSVDTLDWESLARDRQTLAFYMAVRRFPDLMSKLIANGRAADTPIAIVERGTTTEQRVLRGTLGQLTLLAAAHRIQAPAMLIVGDVAAIGGIDRRPAPQPLQNCATPSYRVAKQG